MMLLLIQLVAFPMNDAVVQRAVALLASQNIVFDVPVVVVDQSPKGLPAVGYRLVRGGVMSSVIYIVRASFAYRGTVQGDAASTIELASTLVHEMAHGRGADEAAARKEQEAFLRKSIVRSAMTMDQIARLMQVARFSHAEALKVE